MNFVSPDDERFAEFLRTALKDVHTPVPAPPREEIWAGIMDHRRGARISAAQATTRDVARPIDNPRTQFHTEAAAPVAAAPLGTSQNPTPRRRYAIPMRWALPIAAAVLVAGVGVGWHFEHAHAPKHADTAAATTPTRLPKELPTQVAAEQHFNEVEQLLATFAAVQNEGGASAANNAAVEAEVAAWARDLLATTQLLLDSPLGMDPQRRKLLTDVEMVLVQIAQLAPNSIPDDRELTERSIEKSQMMERLQHVAPTDGAGHDGASAKQVGSGGAPQGI